MMKRIFIDTKTVRNTVTTVLALMLMLASPTNALAAAGDLDTTYDTDGLVISNIGAANDDALGMTVQPDGKVIIVGSTSGNFFVARYTEAGALDTTFDTDGIVTTDFGGTDAARDVVVRPDGKIIVVGTTSGGGGDIALAMYTSTGALDTDFDTDGMVTTDVGTSSADSASAIALENSGLILVAGDTDSGGGDFLVIRYNLDGSLDTSFSGDGIATADIGTNSADEAYAIAVDNNHNIVVAGTDGQDAAVAYFDFDGALNTAFNSTGTQAFDMGTADDVAYDIDIQGNGKIVLAGSANAVDFFVARINPGGGFDNTFSSNGFTVTDIGASTADNARGVAIQPDGRIVVAGDSAGDIAVVRYNADGTLDTNFSTDGKTTADAGGTDTINALTLQPNGQIVVAGNDGSGDALLARFTIVTKEWDGGGGDDNWSTAANWSDNIVPDADDVVLFSTGDSNATIDTGFAGIIGGIIIDSGYANTLTQGLVDVVVKGSYYQAGGTFTGTFRDLDIDGSLILETGVTFTSSENTLTLGGGYWVNNTVSGFAHNQGDVAFGRTGIQIVSGNVTGFNNLTIGANAVVFLPGTNQPTVRASLTNNGTLGQIQPVNSPAAGVDVEFLRILDSGGTNTLYYGVELNPTDDALAVPDANNDLGDVVVLIREVNLTTEFCTSTEGDSPAYGSRCYTVKTTQNNGSELTVWIKTSDIPPEITSPNIYRNSGGSTWTILENLTSGTSGNYTFIEGDTPGFSGFLIAAEQPTAISLRSFSASNGGVSPWLILAAAGLLAIGGLYKLQMASQPIRVRIKKYFRK